MMIPRPPPVPMPPQVWPTLTLPNIWDLGAQSGKVRTAAAAWGGLAGRLADGRDGVDTLALALRGDAWSGDASDAYHAHRTALGVSVDDTATAARTAEGALYTAASALTTAQTALSASLATLRRSVHTVTFGPVIWVRPESAEETATVRSLVRGAYDIRDDLDDALGRAARELDQARSALAGVLTRWSATAEGTTSGWTPPAESTRLTWIDDGEQIVVSTGSGDDAVEVRVDPATGDQVVVVNGQTLTFPPGRPIVIRTGSGADRVTVEPGTSVRLTILAGDGDDWISGGAGGDRLSGGAGSDVVRGEGGNDRIYGGAGQKDDLYAGDGHDVVVGGGGMDYIDGGAGRDALQGGTGNDTLYGMGGGDTLVGGEGHDYLEGARGSDTVIGGAGDDIVSGGRGGDALHGGSGSDVMYGGDGRDTADGGVGNDTAYVQGEDRASAEHVVLVDVSEAGSFIKIEGSPDFVARVEADLDMLRASPTGHEMLEGLDKAHEDSDGWFSDGDGLTITELVDEQNGFAVPDSSWGTQTYGIRYNPSFDTLKGGTPPVVVIYHEMAHVWDYSHDTIADGVYTGPDNPGVNNLERVAVGLPYDHDGDPGTPDQLDPDHDYAATENALREEIGYPRRDTY